VYVALVGVSEYPNLPNSRQLLGPKSDVRELRRFLLAAGVPSTHVSVLADGLPESLQLPTRSAILDLWKQQQAHAQRGDTVLLYFAGHGAQQPQLMRSGFREPDGLDELFLPRDTGRWEDAGVVNAIVDDEIGAHIDRLREDGINVIAWFDSCHAGDSVRNSRNGTYRTRAVPAEDLGVPIGLQQKAIHGNSPTKRALGMSANTKRSHTVRPKPATNGGISERGYLIALYASRPHERTREEVLPIGRGDHREYRGVFTATVLEVLRDDLVTSTSPGRQSLSAQDLIARVKATYLRKMRNNITPYYESDPPEAGQMPLLRLLVR